MALTVEFLGHARRLTGCKFYELEIGNEATYGDLLRQLVCAFPALSGEIFDPKTGTLTPAYSLMREDMRPVRDLQERPMPQERVILMFAEAGG